MTEQTMNDLLKQALIDSLEEETDEWTQIDRSEQYAVPKKAYSRMKKTVHHAEIVQKYGKVIPILARVAIYLLIIIGIASALTVVTVAIHKQRIFSQSSEDGTYMKMTMLEDAPAESEESNNLPLSYVPEGFKLSLEESNTLSITSYYENTKGCSFRITRTNRSDNELNIDAENQKVKTIWINGYEGYVIKSDDLITLVWTDLNYSYCLNSYKMSEKEVKKIAENIE